VINPAVSMISAILARRYMLPVDQTRSLYILKVGGFGEALKDLEKH
jgi:hypothetical protein